MRRVLVGAASVAVLALSGCTHSEDRRWQALVPVGDYSSDDGKPSVRVYSIPSVAPSAGKTRLRDLSEAGQAAFIDAMAKAKGDAERDALRRALSVPLEGRDAPETAVDRTQLRRTLIVSINKGWGMLPGDRLMRTVVRIRPHQEPGKAGAFEFAGYTIAATDNETQDIAQLETNSQASLSATLAPKIGGFGDNNVQAGVSRSHKTSADIQQEYTKLNIDIIPQELVITRESERGHDVVGNTFVELTLAPISPIAQNTAFIADAMTLSEGGKPLSASRASIDVKPVSYLPACPLLVDVDMKYLIRRVAAGREYYTEGKQTVGLVRGALDAATFQLVRPQEAQAPLFQIVSTGAGEGGAVFVTTADRAHKRLLFDNFEDARRLADWIGRGGGGRIAKSGLELRLGSAPLPRGGHYAARTYQYGCE